MNKLNYSEKYIDASNKNQKSPFNRKRLFPQDSPPAVQNFPKISGNMINPLSQLPQNRTTGQFPILSAPANPMTVSPQTAKVLINSSGNPISATGFCITPNQGQQIISLPENSENGMADTGKVRNSQTYSANSNSSFLFAFFEWPLKSDPILFYFES